MRERGCERGGSCCPRKAYGARKSDNPKAREICAMECGNRPSSRRPKGRSVTRLFAVRTVGSDELDLRQKHHRISLRPVRLKPRSRRAVGSEGDAAAVGEELIEPRCQPVT